MAFVYWLGDGAGRNVNTGGANGSTPIPTAMMRWVRAKGKPALIVNGGDVYPDGKTKDFDEFLAQMDNDVTSMCETAGNHDWRDDILRPGAGRIPHGYELFWKSHPESAQPVDHKKMSGARYEHFIDIEHWRLIFLDTGDYDANPWPGGDATRMTWLKSTLAPGRGNMIFMHHSRLSWGHHGDNEKLDRLWKALFDASGAPRAAFTLAGHDHNVSVYGPRPMNHPESGSVKFDKGIHVIVNGAGGKGHYTAIDGTKPDHYFDDDHFCLTRINIINAKTVDVDVLDFGTDAKSDPKAIPQSLLQIRL